MIAARLVLVRLAARFGLRILTAGLVLACLTASLGVRVLTPGLVLSCLAAARSLGGQPTRGVFRRPPGVGT